ncbi:hypothetical protein PROP_03127 [Propionicimonas sp. T2.31MG-18]|uniref:DUF7668 domain-containing protein n=1 Tax=Propionicimonas sp. T2.31MG-18 TaxID=3157620 RepID=UPI0035F065C3
MAVVPERFRDSIRRELSDLVAGTRPELMTWVDRYGKEKAVLMPQPEEIWTHDRTDFLARPDGSVFVVLPLWTAEESPSDLSAEVDVAANGVSTIVDVRVL